MSKFSFLPDWNLYPDVKPSHGEYLVLLKQVGQYPYLCVANFSYENYGEWSIGGKVITKQIEAYLTPRVIDENFIDEDKPTGEGK